MKKVKVLLVDDEKQFVDTLADRLKMRDLEASTAHNGEEALSSVAQDEPDVIVLDLKMPGSHGIEVLRRIKTAYPNVEVIILTGHGTEKDQEAARNLGAFDYLTKPANIDKLLPRIKKAFKRRMKNLGNMSVAAAFAEAGEFDTAKEIMEDENAKKDEEIDEGD